MSGDVTPGAGPGDPAGESAWPECSQTGERYFTLLGELAREDLANLPPPLIVTKAVIDRGKDR